MISRREFLGGVATMTAAAAPARYNVIVLMSDEHNPFFSQPYGHPFVSTPNMTRLARMGSCFVIWRSTASEEEPQEQPREQGTGHVAVGERKRGAQAVTVGEQNQRQVAIRYFEQQRRVRIR